MALVGPRMIKFFGQYVRIYQNEEELDRNEQMGQVDALRNENLRYFETVVAVKSGGRDAIKDLGPAPYHPAVSTVAMVVAQFQHTSYLLLHYFEKVKDTKKYGSDPLNFFTSWAYLPDIAKFAKLNPNMIETAVGVIPGKENRREHWVTFLEMLSHRFARASPYLLQTDFDQISVILGVEAGKEDPEDLFCRYMVFLYKRLSAIHQVLQAVIHAAMNPKKK